jgi:hypothetical protein
MELAPLFEGVLHFDDSTEVAFPAYGDDGDWSAYVQGDGEVVGDRLAGKLRWTNHPRRRADGTWLPRFDGVIATEDNADVLFSFSGINWSVDDPFEYEHRRVVAALTFATSNDRYRWVNTVLSILEADVRVSADRERWRIRAFECRNDIDERGDSL